LEYIFVSHQGQEHLHLSLVLQLVNVLHHMLLGVQKCLRLSVITHCLVIEVKEGVVEHVNVVKCVPWIPLPLPLVRAGWVFSRVIALTHALTICHDVKFGGCMLVPLEFEHHVWGEVLVVHYSIVVMSHLVVKGGKVSVTNSKACNSDHLCLNSIFF